MPLKGLDSPLSSAVASLLSDVSWCSGTYEALKEDLCLYYRSPTETDPKAAKCIDFSEPAAVEELENLVQQCQPASFGRGDQDVHDPSYRKAGKLDPTQFSTTFHLSNSGILDALKSEMLIEHDLRAELYKLNVYDKGCFFKTHKDTPRSENMIASLVIVLPTKHEGGSLILRHDDGKEFEFDSGKELSGSTSKVAYVAFFSDTDHEVKEVTSGHRVTLTYNLYVSTSTTYSSSSSVRTRHDEQDKELLDAIQNVLDGAYGPTDLKCTRFGFGLQHQYAFWKEQNSLALPHLKGSDAALVRVCQKLGLTSAPYVLYRDHYEPDEYHLADRLIKEGEVYEGGEEWRHSQYVDEISGLYWVTDPRETLNVVESRYIAYGNEHSPGCAYGHIVVIAERK